jgi:hypothetical protein
MSGTTNSTASCVLEKSGNDLHWLLQSTESAMAALVTDFQDLTGDTGTLVNHAAAVVECIEAKNVNSVLPSVETLGVAAKQFVGDRLQATAGILETATIEMALLKKLSRITDGQTAIAARIQLLDVHTKIEIAHLGSVGAGFEYLARELGDFSVSLARNTGELISHTESHKDAIEKTHQMFSVELPHLTQELSRIEANLIDDLAVLQAGLARISQTPVHFRVSAEDIARQIAGVVVAVQGHDITRQQIEHVQEALVLVSQALLAEHEQSIGVAPQAARAHAGLAIQIFQLRAIKDTIAGWTSQIRMCMGSILKISASDLVGIGPLVVEQERLMLSQLSHIELLESQCQGYSERIRSTLEGISNLSQLVTEHLQKSESARNRLRMLTFNSVIEASRLGAQADTICVIADGIAEISVEWSRITEQSGSVLREIFDLSKHVNKVMDAFSHAGVEKLRGAQAETRAGLESLRGAVAFVVTQGQKAGTLTELMCSKSTEVAKASDQLDACFSRIDTVLADLEAVKRQLEIDHPGVERQYDCAEVERLFSAFYTTQTERDVLCAAIYGTELSAPQACVEGNSVELF